MPEAAIIEDQQTGFFFNENDIDDLSLKIDLWFSKFDFNLTRAERRRIIDEKYNPEYQIKVIQKAIDEKISDTKRIYINLSNISTGGSIQVAMSFIEHFVKSEINPKFYFLFSRKLYVEINNSHLAPYLNQLSYKITSKRSLFFYFTKLCNQKKYLLYLAHYIVLNYHLEEIG